MTGLPYVYQPVRLKRGRAPSDQTAAMYIRLALADKRGRAMVELLLVAKLRPHSYRCALRRHPHCAGMCQHTIPAVCQKPALLGIIPILGTTLV